MSGGFDSGGKGDGGGKAKEGGGFLDGLRSFGSSVLDGFLGNATSSGAAPARRRDPVATRDRPAAAKQIHRSLKAWRDKQPDDAAAGDSAKQEDDQKAGTATAEEGAAPDAAQSSKEDQPAGADAKAGDSAESEGDASEKEEAGERAGAEEGAPEEQPAEVATKSISVAAKLKGVFRKIFRAPPPGGGTKPTLTPAEKTMLAGMVGGPDLLAKLGKVAPDKEASLIQEAKVACGEALAGGAQVMIGHIITAPGATKALTEIDVETADILIQVKGGNYAGKRKLSDDDMDQLTNTKRYNEKMRIGPDGKKLPPKKIVYQFTQPIPPELDAWLRSKGVNDVRVGRL